MGHHNISKNGSAEGGRGSGSRSSHRCRHVSHTRRNGAYCRRDSTGNRCRARCCWGRSSRIGGLRNPPFARRQTQKTETLTEVAKNEFLGINKDRTAVFSVLVLKYHRVKNLQPTTICKAVSSKSQDKGGFASVSRSPSFSGERAFQSPNRPRRGQPRQPKPGNAGLVAALPLST
jgi:hypothetical protein